MFTRQIDGPPSGVRGKTDFEAAINALDGVIAEWKEKRMDNRDTYHSLYTTIIEHDKLIARRYDGLTGSHYVDLVAELYIKGAVSETDIAGLSEETMNTIRRYKYLSDNR